MALMMSVIAPEPGAFFAPAVMSGPSITLPPLADLVEGDELGSDQARAGERARADETISVITRVLRWIMGASSARFWSGIGSVLGRRPQVAGNMLHDAADPVRQGTSGR